MIPPPKNVLLSYAYFNSVDISQFAPLNIIGDSGAFTVAKLGQKITVKELATWAKTWEEHLYWVASLDVIGDSTTSRHNWEEMRQEYGVNAIPTIHYGCNPTEMDYYAKRGCDYIGLGGLVGVPTRKRMQWLIPVFRHQQKSWPNLQFHGWGATTEDLLQLPFLSVDSSSWTQAFRFGQAIIRDPNSLKDYRVDLNGRDAYEAEIAKLLRTEYGINPRDVAISNASTRPEVTRLSLLAASVQEQRFRRRHPKPKQSTWIASTQTERTQHLATTASQYVRDQRDLYLASSAVQDTVEHRDIFLACGSAEGNTSPKYIKNINESN